jgi:ParB family chromosome partitioning protein
MMQTLDELAENSMRLLDGEAIVQIDPTLLDPSPYADRIGEDEDEFAALVTAIRDVGQSSPILVRPHPDNPQRYVIVYGHRRAKAARELGVAVRAVIKPLEDIAHIIAQGQENTARADLSFIEKALFAKKLTASGISKDDVKRSLTIDDTLLSRMLSVVEGIHAEVLEAIGAAKGIGRDRWEQLKKELQHPAKTDAAREFIASGELDDASSDQRFSLILDAVSKLRRKKSAKSSASEKSWSVAGGAVKVATKGSDRSFTLAVKSKDASGFGVYLSQNLERLYAEFQQAGAKQEIH